MSGYIKTDTAIRYINIGCAVLGCVANVWGNNAQGALWALVALLWMSNYYEKTRGKKN